MAYLLSYQQFSQPPVQQNKEITIRVCTEIIPVMSTEQVLKVLYVKKYGKKETFRPSLHRLPAYTQP